MLADMNNILLCVTRDPYRYAQHLLTYFSMVGLEPRNSVS